MIRIMLFIIQFYAITVANQNSYQIKLYNIPVAKAIISRSDTMVNNIECKVITFSAVSNKLTNIFFPIDNYYSMIIEENTYNVLNFKKETYQPGLSNTIQTQRIGSKTYYLDTMTEIPKGAFNIFTLLDYISYNDYSKLLKQDFLLEREGIHYKAQMKREKDYLVLDINNLFNDKRIVEFTDIFSWAVFKDGASRMIWIDQESKRISKCLFEVNGINLEAILDE